MKLPLVSLILKLMMGKGGGGGRVVDFCLRSAVLFSVLCEPSQDVLCFAGLVALVCSVSVWSLCPWRRVARAPLSVSRLHVYLACGVYCVLCSHCVDCAGSWLVLCVTVTTHSARRLCRSVFGRVCFHVIMQVLVPKQTKKRKKLNK